MDSGFSSCYDTFFFSRLVLLPPSKQFNGTHFNFFTQFSSYAPPLSPPAEKAAGGENERLSFSLPLYSTNPCTVYRRLSVP